MLGVLEDTIVIPFSAETKQGREEIWNLIESLVELPEDPKAVKREQEKLAAVTVFLLKEKRIESERNA